MRSKIFVALVVFTFLFGFVGVSPIESQDYWECDRPSMSISKPRGWAGDNALKGRGTVQNLKKVVLLAIEASYDVPCGDYGLKTFILRDLTVNLKTTVATNLWQNVFLVVDKNGNFQADADEERWSMTVAADKLIAQNLSIRLPLMEKKILLVVSDFSEIRENDSITVSFNSYSDPVKVEPVETKPAYYVFIHFSSEVTHYRGNRAPELFFLGQAPYSNQYAVFPREGSPQEEFEFSVQYRDEDGDKPVKAEVWIDENDNGVFEAGERFPMVDMNPEKSFREPHTFSFKKNFAGSNLKVLRFKFNFADAYVPATKGKVVGLNGLDPAAVFDIRFNQNILVMVGDIRESGYLPGEIIAVKLGVLVYYQGAYDIDWHDFRKNLSAKLFAIKGLSVGERRYYNKLYDIEEATVFFEAPNIRAEKKYALELPGIRFAAKVDGRTGKIAAPRIEIPVTLKPRIEGSFVNHLAIRVGEPLTYRVRSVRLSDVPRPQELDKLTFKPFVEVKRDIKTTKNGPLTVEDFVFTLMLFEAPGDYQIPAFSFPSGKLSGFTVKLLPSQGAGKLTLPYVEKSLRVVPRAALPRLGEVMLGASALVLLFLVRRPLRAGLRAMSRLRFGRTWQERVREAHWRLRVALGDAKKNPCRETLLILHRDIHDYLAAIADPTNAGECAGADARTFRKALAGSVDRSLLDTFVELEDGLMSSGEINAEELLTRLDQLTIAMYAQLN